MFAARFDVVSLLLRHPSIVSFVAYGGISPLNFVARYAGLQLISEPLANVGSTEVEKRRFLVN